jgi:hypothetical protein
MAKKTAKKSTALARVSPKRVVKKQLRRELVVQKVDTALDTILGEEANLGAVGLVEVKLTKKEEAELALPVDQSDVRIKPTGQVYVPHTGYTAKFNKTFGRLGWALIAKARPVMSEKVVICPYVLYIHGKPAAFAYGEQDYFSGNKNQSYGDAVEATHASALRRCSKRLGLWPELWDKSFNDSFMRQHCLIVKTPTKNPKFQWRRRVDPPLPGEVGVAAAGEFQGDGADDERGSYGGATFAGPDGSERRANDKPAYTGPKASPTDARKITEKQVGRLRAIISNSGRDKDQVKSWIKGKFGYAHGADVQVKDYDTICAAIMAPGPLSSVE